MKTLTLISLLFTTSFFYSQDDTRCVSSDTYNIMSNGTLVKNIGNVAICYNEYYFSFKTPENGLITFKIERHTRNKTVEGNETIDSFLNEETHTEVRGFYHVDISQGPELQITINYPMVENGYAILVTTKKWANGNDATFEIISSLKKTIKDTSTIIEKKTLVNLDSTKIKPEFEIYEIVDKSAEFPGGIAELMKYIQNNIQYPNLAEEKRIVGKCFLKFVVLADGTIGEIKLLKGVPNCKECDNEAIKLVQNMPNWTPAKVGNKFVNSWYTLPLSFTIK